MYNDFKLADGYALNVTDGYSFTSDWTDVRSYEAFSCHCVFSGGTPTGTLTLQQSNDRQNGGGNKVTTLFAAGRDNSSGVAKRVDDSVNVPTGNGAVTQAVTAANTVYILDQRLCTFGWFRVVYTASANANVQLDIFTTVKNYQ